MQVWVLRSLVHFGRPSRRRRRIPKPHISETTLGGGFKSIRFRFGFVWTPETDWNRKPWRHRPTPRPSSQWLLSPRSLRTHNNKDDGGLQACNRSAADHVPCWVAKPLFIETVDWLFVCVVSGSGGSLYAHARLFFLFNFLLDFCSRSSAPYGPGMCTTAFLQIYPVSLDSVFTEILRNRIDRNRNGFARFGFVWTGPEWSLFSLCSFIG